MANPLSSPRWEDKGCGIHPWGSTLDILGQTRRGLGLREEAVVSKEARRQALKRSSSERYRGGRVMSSTPPKRRTFGSTKTNAKRSAFLSSQSTRAAFSTACWARELQYYFGQVSCLRTRCRQSVPRLQTLTCPSSEAENRCALVSERAVIARLCSRNAQTFVCPKEALGTFHTCSHILMISRKQCV